MFKSKEAHREFLIKFNRWYYTSAGVLIVIAAIMTWFTLTLHFHHSKHDMSSLSQIKIDRLAQIEKEEAAIDMNYKIGRNKAHDLNQEYYAIMKTASWKNWTQDVAAWTGWDIFEVNRYGVFYTGLIGSNIFRKQFAAREKVRKKYSWE